jgi:hypothetical protein
MNDHSALSKPSRRNLLGMCGSTLALGALGGGMNRALAQPAPPVLPTVGNVRVAGVDILINNSKWPIKPLLSVDIRQNGSYNGTAVCALEMASGIEIVAEVTLAAAAGHKVQSFGRLAFLQLTQYSRKRTPSGLPGANPNASACATSGGLWRLDGQYPYHRRYFPCSAGLNNAKLTDGPNVGTEDTTVYELVQVDPRDRFQSWLIWEANALQRHVLARVDWFWQGVALGGGATGATCPSPVLHKQDGWQLQPGNGAQVSDVVIGQAAGVPAMLSTPRRIPVATPQAWVAC